MSGKIVDLTKLERCNPSSDGVTTAALAGNQPHDVANPRIDKKNRAELDPFQIFALPVWRRMVPPVIN